MAIYGNASVHNISHLTYGKVCKKKRFHFITNHIYSSRENRSNVFTGVFCNEEGEGVGTQPALAR